MTDSNLRDKGVGGRKKEPVIFEIAMALLTISASFPSKSRFSATFSILLRFGGFWNQQIVRNSTLRPLPFNSWKSENRVSKSRFEFPALASI